MYNFFRHPKENPIKKELTTGSKSGEMKVAFALYPVSMKQIIDIADTGNIMPPKTTV